MVKSTGYGIAVPTIKDMKLDKPEIVKQGGKYGIKLKAVAPSIHMIRVDVESTFEPIIGSELQSKELIILLLLAFKSIFDISISNACTLETNINNKITINKTFFIPIPPIF